MDYEKPIRRLREVLEVIDTAFADGVIDYDGEVFELGPYPAAFDSREAPPSFVAANGPTSQRLTGAHADGWIPFLLPLSHFDEILDNVYEGIESAERSRDDLTVAPFVPSAVAMDADEAERSVREYIAQEVAVGYDSQLARFGYGEPAEAAAERWRQDDQQRAVNSLPSDLVKDLALFGTPEQFRERLEDISNKDVDVVVLAPPFSHSYEDVAEMIELVDA